MDAAPKIISCEVLRNEVERVNPGYEVEFFEGALHDYPDRLRAAVQERIDATPGERDILLCCGRCSNGTAGLQAGPHRLTLPAVDDCISLLLGSKQRYLEEHAGQPGTYYYTRGWIDFLDDPYKEYLKILPKYGEEKAARVARLIMEHYTRLAVIDTPGVGGLDEKRDYLATVSAFYDLPLEHLRGSLRFLEKLMHGPHDEEFLIVEPGDVLEESRFWALAKV
ncbi:MAG: DUF1638 domain-containing protein [Actinobacteria bacterium]|nr:DUF1638 domain-containing protein [Actinomycetota bacterium]